MSADTLKAALLVALVVYVFGVVAIGVLIQFYIYPGQREGWRAYFWPFIAVYYVLRFLSKTDARNGRRGHEN